MSYIGVEVFDNIDEVGDVTMDLIISSHSLEHFQFDQIIDVLKKIYSKISLNGIFLVEVPNVDFINNKLWLSKEHEPHTLFFSVKALELILQKIGFEILFLETTGDIMGQPASRRRFGLLSRIKGKLRQYGFFLDGYGGKRSCVRAVCIKKGR